MSTTSYRSGTLHHALAQLARTSPRRNALLWDDSVFTWEDLLLESLAMAEALLDAGVTPGDNIAAWGTSAPFHVVSLFAAGMVEAVQVPLNPRWPQAWLREAALGTSVLISDGRLPVTRWLRRPKVLSWSSRERAHPRVSESRVFPGEENNPVTVDFTRGRDGASPRGALLTHGMVLGNAAATARVLDIGSDDVVAYLFPSWQHPHELVGKGLAAGCTSIGVDFPYPRTILSLLGRHSPTWIIGSPRVIEGLLPFGDRLTEALQGVRGIVLVGDYARPRLVSRLAAAKLRLFNAWGSAETAGIALLGEMTTDTVDGCGVPCPGYEASVRSSSGAKEGELLIRGPAVSLSYLGRRPVLGAEGWFDTGDLVRLMPDGTLRLVGRPGEAVLGEGRRISLARLETTIARMPGVGDVAALQIPPGSDSVAVYIEPEGTTISIAQIIRKLRQFFGPVVPEICVVRSLPRSADGRIDKARLVAGGIPPMNLEAVDKAMLELLNRRALLSAEAPRGDESPLSADETVLQRMVGSNAGPLFDDSVREIFRCILDHSKRT